MLGLQAACHQADDFCLPLAKTAGPRDSGRRLPRCLDHGGDGVRIEPLGAGLLAEQHRGAFSRERFAVRPWLGHRVVGVSGGKQARRWIERRGGSSAVITGAVQSLVVGARDRGERGKKGRARQNALGVIRVQPDPLPFVRRQRAGPIPDPSRHRDPPQVVHECGAPDRLALAARQAPVLRRLRDQPCHSGRVANQGRRHEIGKSAHRRERTIDRLPFQHQPRLRLGGKRLLPSGCLGIARQDLIRVVREAVRDLRVKCASRALADDRLRLLHASQQILDGGVPGDIADSDRERDLLPLGPP